MSRGPLWTSAEEELAMQLSERHTSDTVFFTLLGRTKSSWSSHLMQMRRKAGTPPKKYCYAAAPYVSSRPTEEMYIKADARIVAPYRSQIAALCGDPPLGYSALDKRISPCDLE